MGCDVCRGKSSVLYCNWPGQVRASNAHRPAAPWDWTIYWKNFQRKTMRTRTKRINKSSSRAERKRSRGSPWNKVAVTQRDSSSSLGMTAAWRAATELAKEDHHDSA